MKKFQLELTFTAMFLWGLGLTFLLSWVFILGILVGRGDMSIGIIKDKWTSAHGGVETVETPPDPVPAALLNQDPKFDFYEELASKKEVAPEEVKQSAPEKPPLPIIKPIRIEPTAPPVENKPEENKKVSPQSPQSEVKDSQYVLQIGSFQDKATAAGLVRRLNARGYSTFFSTTRIRGKQFYRVKCGPFKTETEADHAKRILAGRERVHGFVTRAEN